MTVKDRKLPVIQKTEDGQLLNIDGATFEKRDYWEPITIDTYNAKVTNRRKLLTWDCALGTGGH